jgi:hypothetical protein
MIFNPWNCSLKNWECIKTLIPKVGAHLQVCGFIPSHSPIIMRSWMWLLGYIICPHLFKPLPWSWTLAFVASPRLGHDTIDLLLPQFTPLNPILRHELHEKTNNPDRKFPFLNVI